MRGLIEHLQEAVEHGSVPRPVPSEPMDDYRLRVAHAGAMVAFSWLTQRHEEQAEAELEELHRALDEVTPGGATVTPLSATPLRTVPVEQDTFPEAGDA